ncbi:hypothetical protein [Streptomyces sp. SID12501]|uniref:Uncharacterized protein n=1 Tax=Streptomyces sp. SID12501 TaxID=2706042 RepID=A0A6B3BTK3_9ACTN|nr:hypothetical protein [Streptomyces sp. SID12501]NEC87656.1 hypothetical protein [Streptomyces sp. SID12501]
MMLGSTAPQENFDSTWTWTAAIGLVTLLVTTYFSVDQLRKRRKAAEAKRLKPDYDLLDEVVVVLGKLEALSAQKADLAMLNELRSRIKQAERRSPDLLFGEIVARIDIYQKAMLPDCFGKKLAGKRVTLDDLLELSRKQGAALTEIRVTCDAVQLEIDGRTT